MSQNSTSKERMMNKIFLLFVVVVAAVMSGCANSPVYGSAGGAYVGKHGMAGAVGTNVPPQRPVYGAQPVHYVGGGYSPIYVRPYESYGRPYGYGGVPYGYQPAPVIQHRQVTVYEAGPPVLVLRRPDGEVTIVCDGREMANPGSPCRRFISSPQPGYRY